MNLQVIQASQIKTAAQFYEQRLVFKKIHDIHPATLRKGTATLR